MTGFLLTFVMPRAGAEVRARSRLPFRLAMVHRPAMRIATLARVACSVVGLGLLVPNPSAHAEIIGLLEAPNGYASGISNVQGWVYTNTPGAELIQPFSVLIDGVEQFKVPCCGDRGDVQAVNPGAPLLTGFSGVYNWGLAWVDANPILAADAPQGGPPSTEVTVQVLVTDTMGGFKLLTKNVDLYNPTPWPRSKLAQWEESLVVSAPQGIVLIDPVTSECALMNDALYLNDAASLRCQDLVFTAPDDSTITCPNLYFDWDVVSQSFKLTSDCFGGMVLK